MARRRVLNVCMCGFAKPKLSSFSLSLSYVCRRLLLESNSIFPNSKFFLFARLKEASLFIVNVVEIINVERRQRRRRR